MHCRHLLSTLLLWAACAATALAQGAAPPGRAAVGFSIVKTAKVTVRQGLLFSGGSFSQPLDANFSAFLVRHGDTQFLFDSGLGAQVAAQYRQDMQRWGRPFFRYEEPVVPVRDQLAAAGIGAIPRIILSHGHWDHASGIEDFPGVQVWAAAPELDFLRTPAGGIGGAWPSQVSGKPVSWHVLPLRPQPYEGFDASLDLFGDGSIVLVTMYGHTPGSVGMFVTVSSGRRFFFVGDAVWSAAALQDGQPKFWAARLLVDGDAEATAATIAKIRAVIARDPAIVVVPAHDSVVQNALGYLPKWIE